MKYDFRGRTFGNLDFWVAENLPLPKSTQTIAPQLGQNCDLGEEQVVSYPETSIDPNFHT